MEFEAECYHSMILDKGISKADDRKETIELQSDKSLNLDTSILKAIVIPSSFISNEYLQSLKSKIGFEVLHYQDFGQQSNYFYSEVLRITREYMKSLNVYANV